MNKNKGIKILIAEDEYIILRGLKSALERLGHQIIGEVNNGKKAVEIALERKPDLIIMDINMPLLNGIEAIKKINEKLLIPSIIVTGYNKKELIEEATDVGVFAYLIKPIDEKELKPAIEIAMGRFKEFKSVIIELKQTQNTLAARKYIEKAKGILIDKFNLKETEAMKLLQKKSNDKNQKLITVAKEIIKADEILSIGKKK